MPSSAAPPNPDGGTGRRPVRRTVLSHYQSNISSSHCTVYSAIDRRKLTAANPGWPFGDCEANALSRSEGTGRAAFISHFNSPAEHPVTHCKLCDSLRYFLLKKGAFLIDAQHTITIRRSQHHSGIYPTHHKYHHHQARYLRPDSHAEEQP